MFIRTFLFSLLMLSVFSGCRKTEKAKVNSPLTFSTSFESIDDFKGFYIVPQNYMNTSSHQLTSELFHSGKYSHKVWQNWILVSSAKIADGNGLLAQTHFGLYAAPSVSSGTVYNDDLEINEVSGNNFATSLLRYLLTYYLCHGLRDVSSVGSERMLHTHEVVGSNPSRPTSKSATYENFMGGFFVRVPTRVPTRACKIR